LVVILKGCAMPERPAPTRDEVLAYLHERRNWGRWGEDDQMGAINLITAEKRATAARSVRTGRVVSLSRDFPKTPGPANPQPAQHFDRVFTVGARAGPQRFALCPTKGHLGELGIGATYLEEWGIR